MVSVRESIQARREAATDAYIARRGWFRGSSSDPATMRWLGTRREGAKEFDVVRIEPAGGLGFDAWIDADAYRMDRLVRDQDDGSKQTTWFTDYRWVDGVQVAYSQRISDGDAQFDTSLRVTQASAHATADDAHFAMPASKVNDASIDGDAATATVPFVLYGGLIMVEVSIDGAKPLPFILDTGGLNLLTPQAAAKLHIAGAGNQAVQGVGATQSMQLAQVKNYRVGNVVMRDQRFLIVKLPLLLTDRGEREPIAGLIGYELLRRFVTRVEYDRHMLTFTPLASFHGLPAVASLPIVFNDRTPQIRARVDGVAGTFNLDTGDAGDLTIFAPFAKANGIHPSGKASAGKARGAGGAIELVNARIDSLAIGPFMLTQPPTSFTAPASGAFASTMLAGNIGYGVLSRFVLTFDYEHRRLYLQQGAQFAAPMPRGRTGLALDRTRHEAFDVAAVEARSPAQEAGLRVGDSVIAVDGVPATQLGLDDIRRLMQQPVGSQMRLSVERNGTSSVFELTLRETSEH